MCHTCHKKDKESCRECKYCKEAVYCDAECEAIGWSLHQCNVITVSDPDMTILMTPGSNEQFLTRYVNPKGLIEQRIIQCPAETPARNEANLSDDVGYTMTIEFEGSPKTTGEGLTLADNAIWHGANGIAGRLHQGGDGFTLWPGPSRIQSQNLTIPANQSGVVKINVELDNGDSTHIHALFPEVWCEAGMARQLTPAQVTFQKKFRRGDPKLAAMLPNIHELCAEDVSGNTVKLIFHVKDKEAQLVDVEYPLSRLNRATPVTQKLQFRCNPTDLDQVTGLIMALEDKMASGELEGPVIQQAFDTIDTHRKLLELEGEVAPSPKVNAAVKEATDALWQTIDGRARQRRYLDKLTRGGAPQAKKLAEQLAERMRKARAAGQDKKGPKKWLSSSRKSAIRTELADLEAAIMQMQAQYGLSMDQIEAYNDARNIIRAALSPNMASD